MALEEVLDGVKFSMKVYSILIPPEFNCEIMCLSLVESYGDESPIQKDPRYMLATKLMWMVSNQSA